MLRDELLQIIVNGENSGEQQARLFASGGMLHAEVMPVPKTDINCLDEARGGNGCDSGCGCR